MSVSQRTAPRSGTSLSFRLAVLLVSISSEPDSFKDSIRIISPEAANIASISRRSAGAEENVRRFDAFRTDEHNRVHGILKEQADRLELNALRSVAPRGVKEIRQSTAVALVPCSKTL